MRGSEKLNKLEKVIKEHAYLWATQKIPFEHIKYTFSISLPENMVFYFVNDYIDEIVREGLPNDLKNKLVNLTDIENKKLEKEDEQYLLDLLLDNTSVIYSSIHEAFEENLYKKII